MDTKLSPTPKTKFDKFMYWANGHSEFKGSEMPSGFDSLADVCANPEILQLVDPVTLKFDQSLDVPFVVLNGQEILIGPKTGIGEVTGSILLRHALELALYRRLLTSTQTNELIWACSLLSCHCAAYYFSWMNNHDLVRAQQPELNWLWDVYCNLTAEGSDITSEDFLSSIIPSLLKFEKIDGIPGPVDLSQVSSLFENMRHLAVPTEHILTLGGDTRLQFDPETGLNKLGCSPRPRPWAVTFATSTASSISEPAFWESEELRHNLLKEALSGNLNQVFDSEMDAVKSDILSAVHSQDTGARCILAPSGTDAEFYALHFAMRDSHRDISNIVISPDETGSGVINAVSGKHFAVKTALGASVDVGQAVVGFPADRVHVDTVSLRDGSGQLRPIEEVDTEVVTLVEMAISANRQCLVHLLDSSKTGIGGPSISCISELSDRYGHLINVVVDACQFRISGQGVRQYIDLGFMVLLTGSKFYTGPAFSGALVLPQEMARDAGNGIRLAEGFGEYGTKSEWPPEWADMCQTLSSGRNIGLLFRWKSALWEIKAFNRVPEVLSADIMRQFASATLASLAASPVLEYVDSPVLERAASAPVPAWQQEITIFPFVTKVSLDNLSERYLSMAEAGLVYRWLNQDISRYFSCNLSEEESLTAAKCCHIGQPVQVSDANSSADEDPAGALRISCGGRLVWRVAFDQNLGSSISERLQSQIDDMKLVVRKVEMIAKHFAELRSKLKP